MTRASTFTRGATGLALLLALLGLGGCVPSGASYDYDAIRASHTALICDLGLETTESGAVQACTLPSPLSLAAAVQAARANNPDQKMALARIVRAEAALAGADARFFPRVGAFAEYMRGDAPSAFLFKTIDQRRLPPGMDFNDPGQFDNVEAGLQARWNLYNGGRDRLHRYMAAADRTMARLDHQAVDNALVAAVIQTFYDALAARDQVAVAEETAASVQEQLRVIRVRYDAGGALKSDVLSLEVRLAQARQEFIRSGNRRDVTLAVLADLIGVGADTALALSAEPLPAPDVPADYAAGVATALQRRPELRRMRERVRRSRMALDLARSSYLPTVDLGARYYHDDPDGGFDAQRGNWTAAVTVDWELFNGFATRAEVRQAQADLSESLVADHKQLLAVRLDAKQAYLHLGEARARLAVARAAVASADESLVLVKRQYEGGSAAITRYLEAELDRNRSRQRAIVAFYDQQKALAEVARAVGYWAYESTAPEENGTP